MECARISAKAQPAKSRLSYMSPNQPIALSMNDLTKLITMW